MPNIGSLNQVVSKRFVKKAADAVEAAGQISVGSKPAAAARAYPPEAGFFIFHKHGGILFSWARGAIIGIIGTTLVVWLEVSSICGLGCDKGKDSHEPQPEGSYLHHRLR